MNLASFLVAGGLSVFIADRYQRAVSRLTRERTRLQAALEAASAAVWELSPNGKLYWDEHFYRLVGLDPSETPPATATFLEMIHPEDRPRLSEARRLMSEGRDPPRLDEYRLTRPNGDTIWLENHRTRVQDGGNYFIGITQDVTRRKLAELGVQALLRESDHRAKNQLAVIMSVVRETSRTAREPAAFEEALALRLQGLARSHDLMIKGNWKGTTLRDLAVTHLEPFCSVDRCDIDGPDVAVSANAAQYLGMAFHELATNAVKYGALQGDAGRVRLAWDIRDRPEGAELALTWTESGAPAATQPESAGFGTKVLQHLVPGALSGRAERRLQPEGMVWEFVAPLASLSDGAERQETRTF